MFTISRRAFLAGCGAAVGSAVGMGYYASMVEPFWAEFRENPIKISRFPSDLSGLRIAHLTDMHLGDRMPADYPAEIARRVREELRPDLVAFTGDLTTHDPRYVDRGIEWLTSFGAPTVMCLGNHDYDPEGSARVTNSTVIAEQIAAAVKGTDIQLLRNSGIELSVTVGRKSLAKALELSGEKKSDEKKSDEKKPVTETPLPTARIWVAGIEDWYTGRADPVAATASMPPGVGRLMLCHNPDASLLVDEPTAGGLVLAGHTHGGQIRIPGLGPVMLPLVDREKGSGQFKLPKGSTLYVSRGVGFLLRARVLCRPEVVVHRIA